MIKLRILLAAAGLTLPMAVSAEGSSPWLPIPGQVSFGISHTEQSADDAYIGSAQVPIIDVTGGGASTYRRSTTQLRLGYGINDAVAVDATFGFGRVRVGAADSDSGQIDSVIGVSWRALDEFERPGFPTLTLRGSAIINGGYDGARLAALGDDQSGFELALLLGKQIVPAVAVWAEAGVQDRSGAVPKAVFYEVGARFRFAPQWSASLGYSDKTYRGDLDIGGPGFDPTRFQEVREERGIVKLGVGYGFASNQGLALNVGRVVSGRNTVKDNQIIGLSYTVAF
jgi:hypothetical protein